MKNKQMHSIPLSVKSFDSVIHSLLIQQLKLILITCYPTVLSLFQSYLYNYQKFQVLHLGFLHLNLTFPKDKNLGPHLSNIFIDDLFHSKKYSDILGFADYVKIFKTISNFNDPTKLQEGFNYFYGVKPMAKIKILIFYFNV